MPPKYKDDILLYRAGVIGTVLFSMSFFFAVSVKSINIYANRRHLILLSSSSG